MPSKGKPKIEAYSLKKDGPSEYEPAWTRAALPCRTSGEASAGRVGGNPFVCIRSFRIFSVAPSIIPLHLFLLTASPTGRDHAYCNL